MVSTKKFTAILDCIDTVSDKEELKKKVSDILASNLKSYNRKKERERIRQHAVYERDPEPKKKASLERFHSMKMKSSYVFDRETGN